MAQAIRIRRFMLTCVHISDTIYILTLVHIEVSNTKTFIQAEMTMEKKSKNKPYHHGNFQTELIEEGFALIHEEGRGNFFLRKLAKRIGG